MSFRGNAAGFKLLLNRGGSSSVVLIPPTITMAVGQTTFPIQLNAIFDPSTLSTDSVRLQVSTNITFTALILDQTITVGSGSQAFPGLSAISNSSELFFREQVIRGGSSSPWSNIVTHGDTVAPVLSAPTGTATGDTTATVGVTSSKAQGTLYWTVLPSGSATPSAAAFTSGATGGVASGSTSSPTAGTNSFSATGLALATAYQAYFFQQDLAGNASNFPVSSAFTTTDVTAPTLSSPSVITIGSTSAVLNVTTNEPDGTLYWFISTSATPPTVAALKAGTGAVAFGNQAVSAIGVQSVTASPLSATTTYYAYLLQTNAASANSAIAATGSFTTAAIQPPQFSQALSDPGITISGGNLTATQGTFSGFQNARGPTYVTSTSSGNPAYYWAIQVVSAGEMLIGLAPAANPPPGNPPVFANQCGYDGGTGTVYNNGSSTSGLPTFTTGDVIGVCYYNNVVWFLKNGVSISGDPVAKTGGFSFPVASVAILACLGAIGQSVTSVLGSPPTGYTRITP